MNLSGLSYLQFLLVDAFVTLYLFWRIHETGSWSAINPLSASRSAARMLAYYFCLIAMALFMGRDGIMAAQELQDVESVSRIGLSGPAGIRQGLRLWTFGMAFLFLALGLVMLNWSSHSVKQVLGDNSPLGDVPGKALAGFGLASFIFTIVAHFVANARLAISCFMLVFLGAMIWVLLRRLQVAATDRPQYRQTPLLNVIYLLEVQTLDYMKHSGILLALSMFAFVLMFMAFDISYLTPGQTVQRRLAGGNTTTGIGTLITAVIAIIVTSMLEKVETMDSKNRATFLGNSRPATAKKSIRPGQQLFSKSRSRMHSNVSEAKAPLVQSAAMDQSDVDSTGNYLKHIPYIDRMTRENSFFGQGPWSAQIAQSNHESSHTSSVVIPGTPQQLEQLVRSNTGSNIVSAEARQDMMRQSVLNNSSALFSESEASGSRYGYPHPNNSSLVQSSVNESGMVYPPSVLPPSANLVLKSMSTTNSGHPSTYDSNPSVRSNQLPPTIGQRQISAQNGQLPMFPYSSAAAAYTNDGFSITAHRDSNPHLPSDSEQTVITTAVLRPPLSKRDSQLSDRVSSFAPETYQYDPITAGEGAHSSETTNPFSTLPRPESKSSERPASGQISTAAALSLTSISTAVVSDMSVANPSPSPPLIPIKSSPSKGPVLIRKGSRASARRKNTLDRSGSFKRHNRSHGDMNVILTNNTLLEADDEHTGCAWRYDSDKRDSSTVGRMGPDGPPPPPNVDQADSTRSLYMQSLTSMQMNRNSDLFSSIGSMHTGATSDAFFTPDSSMAQINIMDGPSIARILSNTSQYSTLSSGRAPPNARLPTIDERPYSAPSKQADDSKDIIHGEIITTSLRRAETLRKAVATDVSAIDVSGTSGSTAPSEPVGSVGDLISAMPVPSAVTSPTTTQGRALL
ncbi:hypothetical protein DL89DRAFT_293659 [Linderina pennispora]|uniref:Uncharacterized protein n=1 Tax=Linderina pennispora TaxID=61395 RepID=A0A1Y1W6T2_9FUNG|nr:uncharacterized protein DL89DRAFT_293659 [Linderina pennispora]ORX69239.1 hypothetical protein DL89DRAFT_293659 [Linderina pennispora]